MIKYYLKFAIRNTVKNKVFTSISVIGLSVGIACCILAFLYIQNQLNYDKHFSNTKNTYLLYHNIFDGTNLEDASPLRLVPELLDNFPEIEDAISICKSEYNIKIKDNNFYPENMVFVDSNFYSFMGWEMIDGDPSSALEVPFNITISEKKATEFFGQENPIGQPVYIDESNYGTITGVFKDIPEQSHIQADFILPLSSLKTMSSNIFDSWGWFSSAVYLKINENSNIEELQNKVMAHWKNVSSEFQEGENPVVRFQKFSDVYLHCSNVTSEFKRGSFTQLVGIAIISLLILIIACFNFINLTTALLKGRFTEAGIKKIVGAGKRQLCWQLLMESAIYIVMSTLLACFAVWVALPYLNNFFDVNLSLSVFSNPVLVIFILLFSIFLLIVNYLFPAIFFTKTSALAILNKSKLMRNKHSFNLWNVLVVSQFVIGIFLIIGTLLVHDQMEFIRTKKLGFDKENILVIENDWDNQTIERYERYKSSLSKLPQVLQVSGGLNVPANGIWNWGDPELLSDPTKRVEHCGLFGVDYEYLDLLGATFLEGENFKNKTSDKNKVIITKTAKERLGIENPIGEIVTNVFGQDREIIGVVDDIQFSTIHSEIKPAMFLNQHEDLAYGVHILIKFRSTTLSETLEKLKTIWDEQNPNHPFGYFFLDKSFEEKYISEARTAFIMKILSIISISLCAIGLFGLSLFIINTRIKEIGIRKVNGSTVSEILILLNNVFLRWVFLAFIIAAPLAYIAIKRWFANFAYTTEISWTTFAFAGLITMLITLLTVSFQSISAARRNPVEALRYE